MFVLAVDVNQQISECTQLLKGDRSAVDPCARPARAVDHPAQQALPFVFQLVLFQKILCGIAGAYLSTGQGAGFVREMSAGKGYIALAAVIFGKWRPYPAFFACLMFGFLEAASARLQGVELPLIGEAPTQFMLALPYIMVVLLLAGFIGKASPPGAIGEPYIK